MAFLRFSRDNRGYEHFSLIQPTTNRRGRTRQRVLYAYRTPPDVKVGREPFDEVLRRTLEAQNPDVSFDWGAILETPIPSADADRWRERRRAERAARQAAAEGASEAAEPEATAPEESTAEESTNVATTEPAEQSANQSSAVTQSAIRNVSDPARRRRPRRRGGRGRPGTPPAAQSAAPDKTIAPVVPPPSEPVEE